MSGLSQRVRVGRQAQEYFLTYGLKHVSQGWSSDELNFEGKDMKK